MSVGRDFRLAVNQMGDRRFLLVLLKALGLTLGVLALVMWAAISGLGAILPETLSLPLIGEVQVWTGLVTGAAVVALLFLSSFLMIPVAALCVGFFLDDIVQAVEDAHYPDLPPIDPLPIADVVIDSVRFTGVVLLVNLLAFGVYLVSAVFAPFVFWAVNGYLLGREYFQLVAGRRLGVVGARSLRRRNRGEIWLAGGLMALPLTIPILNLVIPVLGVATYTHMFHRLQGDAPAGAWSDQPQRR